MSRKLVLVSVFLAVLPVLMVSAKARGEDPLKKAADGGNPFGSVGVVKADESKPSITPKGCHAKLKPHSSLKLHGGEKAILKALKQKTSLDFVETPLKDVLDDLSKKHHIPILMDSSVLNEVGIDRATPITCKLSGIPLRSALEIMLDELQLKWTIYHDVLVITTPTKAESDEYMCTKCYDVTDLLVTAKGYEVQNPRSPTSEVSGESLVMPSMKIASAPAMEPIPPGSSAINRVANDINPIKDAITNIIATKTWVDNGGTGTISDYDRMLVISQTREIHLQIEQFLADLRARRQARPTLSVELNWLWLDAKQRDRLLAGQAKSSHGQRSLAVDRQRLRKIARKVPGFHGQVTCESGIGTAIAAGDRRAIILSAIPVIGGDGIGYQPIISAPNVGVTAQVRPTFVPGTKTAILDIASIITRWRPSRKATIIGAAWPGDKKDLAWNPARVPPPAQDAAKPAPATTPAPAAPFMRTHSTKGGAASCPIDQPVMPTEQIGTTLRVPLGKPVIVGSITFAPAGDAGLGAAKENPVEVYLIATTSIVRGAAR